MSKPITSIPSANILLSSLRSVGYTPETAIADIVDNSLSANASAIDRKSTRLNSSHNNQSRMPSSA